MKGGGILHKVQEVRSLSLYQPHKSARGISPQAFEVSFVLVSPKAAAQLQTPLRNNRN